MPAGRNYRLLTQHKKIIITYSWLDSWTPDLLLLKVRIRTATLIVVRNVMNFPARLAYRFEVARWGVAWAAALVLTAGCASRPALVHSPAAASNADPALGASASTETPWNGARPLHIMAVHRRKCGACHTPVEPGSVHRAEAEAAMRRHRRRAKLSEREWNDMVEYISDDGGLRGRPTAHLP
jgi:hypothetical protein